MDGMVETFDAQAADDSVDDIDRRLLSSSASLMKDSGRADPDDIAEAIVTRCIDVDEPVFRHLLAYDIKDDIEKAVNDLTGEAAVAVGRKLIGAS